MDIKTIESIPPWNWPPETAQILLQALHDKGLNAEERLAAASMAGDPVVVCDELAEGLLKVLHDDGEAEALRGAAAIALGPVLEEMDEEGDFLIPGDAPPLSVDMFRRAKEELRAVHGNEGLPKYVRRCALEAAVRAPEEWHEDAIRAAYSSGDEEWRLAAVFCMACVPGFDTEILEALESANPDIHYQAVVAAGAREVKGAARHVLALLESAQQDKPLLLAAIESAGAICCDEASGAFEKLLMCDDEDVVEAVHETLALNDPSLFLDEDDEDGY